MTAASDPLPPLARPAHAPPAFHVLVKPAAAACNLECAYCYYLPKAALYPGGRLRMSDDLLEIYLRQLLEAHAAPEIVVAWQGGEPTLMGLDFFRRSIAYQEKHRPPGVAILNTIQTNATLIDAEWAEFFSEHNFLVGVSLDGPRPLHDAYRRDKSGQGTFDRTMRGLGYLQRCGVSYNLLTALHRANADHPLEVYRFLRDGCQAQFIQFIPIVERLAPPPISVPGSPPGAHPAELVSQRSITAEQYGAFLIAVFDEWLQGDVGRVFVQSFDAALGAWLGAPPTLCVNAQTCGDALALEHNGDLYSCDHFVDPDHRLGNLRQAHLLELVASPQQRRFGQAKSDLLPGICRDCELRFACNGGCPKDRFLSTPDGEPGWNYLCAGYKAFFSHVDRPMRMMADLIRRNRAPAEFMLPGSGGDAQERLADAQGKIAAPRHRRRRRPRRQE